MGKIPKIALYTKELFRQWVLYLFLLGDAIGVSADLVSSEFSLPAIVYLPLVLIGFLWSGFRVYDKLLTSIPEKYKPISPVVVFSIVEGRSYEYELIETSKSEDRFRMKEISDGQMPVGLLTLFVKLENVSEIPVNLLAINAHVKVPELYNFMVPDVKDMQKNVLRFPKTLESGETFHFIYEFLLFPSSLLTEAQIAVRLLKQKKDNVKYSGDATLEFAFGNSEYKTQKHPVVLSMVPLFDIVKKYWIEAQREEIIELIE